MKFKRIMATALAFAMLASSLSVFAQSIEDEPQVQTTQEAAEPATQPDTSSSSVADSIASSEQASSSEEQASSSEEQTSSSIDASSVSSSSDVTSSEVSSSETSSSTSTSSSVSSSSEVSSSSSSSSSESVSSSEVTEEEAEINAQAADGVTNFVTRMYQIALRREPDNVGLNDWANKLRAGTSKGIDIMVGFFYSPEYTDLNKSDEDFVKDLYLAAFGRTADETGLNDWKTRLSYFVSRGYVIEGFAGSAEFINMCNSFGITPGHLALTENRDKNINVTAFVTRLYKVALGHDPDINGLNDWTGKINAGTTNGAQAVYGFFLSNEYTSKNKSDADYVSDLYNVMLNRSADGGSTTWTTSLDNGVSREYVINGVSGSQEFINLCKQYGINSGSIALTQARDKNVKVTAFVQSFYKGLLKRNGDAIGLNDWVGKLLAGTVSGTNVALGFIGSNEMTGKTLTDAEYVSLMYNVALGRTPSAAEVASWTKYLDYGCTRDYIVYGFLNSQEFKTKCANAGVSYTPYAVTNLCDQNPNVTKFVNDQYKYLLGRTKASAAELNNFISQLNSGKLTGTSLTLTVIGSTEARNYINSISNKKKVKNVYQSLLGRAPSDANITEWANYIIIKGYYAFIKTILKTSEYVKYARDMGVNPGGMFGNLKVTDESGKVHEGDAVTILSHIVAGEVGAMANVEVFKAQTIAAHSWILFKNQNGTAAPTVAWSDSVSATITQSVESVADQVIYYDGVPAMTTYFASCNNATNSSAEVWGNSLPYLVTVSSPYDKALATNWEVTRTYNESQIKDIINKIYVSSYAGNPKYDNNLKAYWAHVTSVTSANGYVERIQSNVTYYTTDDSNGKWVSNPSVKGLYFSEKANAAGIPMRSPNFTIKYNNNSTWTITTYGYGHGVGMSQWGALGYAKAGWSYSQILNHYYPNTTIRTMN